MRATNRSEIAWIVRHLKPRKAAGPDRIQNIINTSTSAEASSQMCCQNINRSLALNYFHTQWKGTTIIMLPKPGKDHMSPLS
jgi:hypothetical protein